jgi:hypothetical protein
MSKVEAVEARIRDLPPLEFASLREWFHEFEKWSGKTILCSYTSIK